MKIIGIIPARFASTRFPGKALADIKGKPMIIRVYEQAVKSKKLDHLIVATDDKRIFDILKKHKGNVIMTSVDHKTGTERCHEVVEKLSRQKQYFDVAINIQGDEPFIQPGQIDTVADHFEEDDIQIATLAKLISEENELHDPNVVKVVRGINQHALYFSRSVIPYQRVKTGIKPQYLKHIGIYAYRVHILKEITALEPSPLELLESLEQLRWLENGYQINIKLTDFESIGVDTPEDLEKLINKI